MYNEDIIASMEMLRDFNVQIPRQMLNMDLYVMQ